MSTPRHEFEGVPVVILCGGKGVLLEGSRDRRINKGLVAIRRKPLFWWVLQHYALHGAADFLLATGLQGLDYRDALESGFGAVVSPEDPSRYTVWLAGHPCTVRVVPTGADAMTGDRVRACCAWLHRAERFCVSYSDTLSDVDLAAQMRFHRASGLAATLVASQMPVRFRVLGMRQDEPVVRAFSSRPVIEAAPINGGYYIFERALCDHLAELGGAGVVLERDILERLAGQGQLGAFVHRGAWQHFDCERDLAELARAAQRLELLGAPAGPPAGDAPSPPLR